MDGWMDTYVVAPPDGRVVRAADPAAGSWTRAVLGLAGDGNEILCDEDESQRLFCLKIFTKYEPQVPLLTLMPSSIRISFARSPKMLQ